MTMSPMFNMMEATRLTREGRLTEAIALLQGARPSVRATATLPDGDQRAETRQTNAGALLDMVPPSKQTGRAWTVPPFGEGVASIQRNDTRRPVLIVCSNAAGQTALSGCTATA
jgi:hypothetical protein